MHTDTHNQSVVNAITECQENQGIIEGYFLVGKGGGKPLGENLIGI